ncbi:response regulator [Halalkalibacter urbisdiaboli]|uniref:response regulator n=1 Tax=Halalkalibacter urbisdiaboli TaxID=1960589 RepID=UPI000B434193|nr:response regulator [Halalkalibacter urbisdiaboli]
MYKIMVVDDEMIERQWLRKIISDRYQSQVEIEEAENGRTAILKAEEFRPDIVFMDIKMPGINGIEAAQEIKKQNHATRFIMVSAFDTFEYARQVMRIGVKEYLLKPSTMEEVIQSLEQVIREIVLERSKREEELMLKDNYRRALSVVQSKVITSLLMGDMAEAEMAEFEDDWERKLEKDSFVMVFEFMKDGESIEVSELKQYSSFIHAHLNHYFWKSLMGPPRINRLPVLIQLREEERTDLISLKSRALSTGKEMIEKFRHRYPNTLVSVGIGTKYHEIDKFVQSYHEAIYALTTSSRPYSCIYYSQQVREGNDSTYPYKPEKRLLEAITAGLTDELSPKFTEYFDAISSFCNGSVEEIKKKVFEFFIVLKRQMIDSDHTIEINEQFLHANVLGALRESIYDEMLRINTHIHSMYYSLNKDVMAIAKDYIEDHYEKPITLEDVSEAVQLSPHYFSKVFKVRTGSSFIDYLTELRVKRAKELMRTKERNLKEICFAVGYKDPNYFSRVFKKVTGMSPSEYRQDALNL